MDDRGKRKLRLYSWVFVLGAVFLGVAVFVDILPTHAFDPTWSDHARFHVTMGASHMLAVALLTLFVAWFPFREGRMWSWFALAVVPLFGLGSIPLIAQWQGSGPPLGPSIGIFVGLAASILALALSARIFFRKSAGTSG